MTEKTEILSPPQLSDTEGQEVESATATGQKKPFVEPEVSFPVDVLEATTFFVGVDSGIVTP